MHSIFKMKYIYIVTIAAVYCIWAMTFIYKSSFLALDGKRYFCLFDDAMISMRYAWNFSHGHGLVWNSGERVEGFTNFLMTIYMSIHTAIFNKVLAVLMIQLSGVVFMLGICFFSMKIGEMLLEEIKLDKRTDLKALCFIAGFSYYPLSFWSLAGMETGMLTIFLFAAIWCIFRSETNHQVSVGWPILCGCAYLTRPDVAILIIIVALYRCLSLTVKNRPWTIYLIEVSILLCFFVGGTLFRFIYYGEMVPNTYVLRFSEFPISFRIENGIGFITPFLDSIKYLIIIAGIGLVLNWSRRCALLYGIVILSIVYQIGVGGDPWNYWRMLCPSIPLLLLLFICELTRIVQGRLTVSPTNKWLKMSIELKNSWLQSAAMYAFFLLAIMPPNEQFKDEINFKKEPYRTKANQRNVNIAIALNEITTDKATIGVVSAGAIPYYSGLPAIDFLGKMDPYIARLKPDLSGARSWNGMKSVPAHNKYNLRYSIVEKKPTYVQIGQIGNDDLTDFLKSQYDEISYKEIKMWLKKNSQDVLWDKLKK